MGMLQPDKRYEIIKPMLNEGKIQLFQDIFQYQKKTVVARDLGKRGPRFDYLIHRAEKFTVEELLIIARLCHLTFDEIMQLVKAQLEARAPKSKASHNNHSEP
ncbi:hypothetical protein [Puia sp.]|uniref:hypothetical protein n=1 Tax=Puia sp. TaxID=2045100 RepID=UPI002F4243B6